MPAHPTSFARARLLPLVVLVLVLAAAPTLHAQATSPAPATPHGTSSIVGVAFDSLHSRPLGGAEVMINLDNRSAVADAAGRFQFDSLPAGTYQIGVFHPLLDSLALSVASAPFHLGPDSVSIVRLGVPSAATLVYQTCKARPRLLGHSVIFGRLLDPDTQQPVPGADVSIVWTEAEVSMTSGVHQAPRLVRDSTDSQGVFRLCGLPPNLDARLQANYRGVTTADVPVTTSPEDGGFLIKPLYVSRADTGAARPGTARVTGRVVFASGAPAPGSRVEIQGSKAVGITNANGEYSLTGAPSGTQMLVVRHIGYEMSGVPVELSSGQPKHVNVQLQKFVAELNPVLVTAQATERLNDIGFTRRQKQGLGTFVTPEELAHRNPQLVTDLFGTMPGLSVSYQNGEPDITSNRGASGCISYFVDGFAWQSTGPGDLNEFVNPREISAIEVYEPSMVPAQFTNPGESCTTIVIWTKFSTHTK